MKAGSIVDAARAGHPAVIAVGVLLLLAAVFVVWLWRRGRPIYPPRGSLTVAKIQEREKQLRAARAKQEHDIQATIEKANEAEFRRIAEAEAGVHASELAADEVTQEIPVVEETTAVIAAVPPVAVPKPRTPSRQRPYTRMRPSPKQDVSA